VIVLTNLDEANPEGIALGIAGILEPALTPPHLLPRPLAGVTPPQPVEQLLRDVEDGEDSTEVTPGFSAVMPTARRELMRSSRIASICYAKGHVRSGEREGNVVFTVLYGAAWRAAGIDLYFF
jgi:hypothetical protein